MSYTNHNSDQCDKCLKEVGRENLVRVPFLYLDRNDTTHPDAVPGNPRYKDYKQYWVCPECAGKW